MDLHPIATHFPIVIGLILSIAEATLFFMLPSSASPKELHRTHFFRGYFLFVKICCGVLLVSAIAAFFTGLSAQDVSDQTFIVPDRNMSVHYQYGRITAFFGVFLAICGFTLTQVLYDEKLLRIGYRLVIVVFLALAGFTGYLGGELVFAHGAGVNASVQFLKARAPSDPELQSSHTLPQ